MTLREGAGFDYSVIECDPKNVVDELEKADLGGWQLVSACGSDGELLYFRRCHGYAE